MKDSFLIKKPLVTERATDLNALGQYVFIVKPRATKPEIRKAIHEIYKVDAISVNVINRPPKRKRFGGVMKGKKEGYRKAIITLKEGQKIEIQ
jgi:large subunit ribosomal protein L23